MNALAISAVSLVLAVAVTAFCLKAIVRSVLLLVVVWFSIAVFYLVQGAEFAGFAQALVYGGAVSMVVLFAVLLTQRVKESAKAEALSRARAASAVVAGAAVALTLIVCILRTPLDPAVGGKPSLPVRRIGDLLLGSYAPALLVLGALLTAALLGAVVVASPSLPDNDTEDPS